MREGRSNTTKLGELSVRRLAMGMALLGLFLVPGLSQALGLGDIEARSALNQPLDAQIELISVRPGEVEDLEVRLAPEALYRRLGIERTGLLTQLRFQAETLPDGRHVIRVTTREAVREPFVNFLVEASWPAGRLVREYTLLLDPPVMFEVGEAPAPAPAARAPAPAPRAEPRRAPPPRAAAPRPDAPDSYRVRSGDTLWNVARNLRPSTDVSVEQMMLALLRANPGAFADDNINNLLSGQVLRVPDQGEINRLSQAEATREVVRQNALWQEYRARAAQRADTQMPAPPSPQTPAPETAEAAEAAPTDADGRLEILAARDAQDSIGDMEQELGLAREAAEARGREVEELRSRVAELEALLERRERLLELTNEQMAELQARLDGAEGGERAVPDAVPDPQPPVAEATDTEAATSDGEPAVFQSEAERMALAALPDDPAAAVAETPAPEEPAAREPAAEPAAEQPAPVPAAPTRSAGMLDDLMANPNALMIVGLVALLVLLLIWLMVRRTARSRSSGPALAVARADGSEMRLDSGATGALTGAAAGVAAAGALTASRDEPGDEGEQTVGDVVTEEEQQPPAAEIEPSAAPMGGEGEAESKAPAESPAVLSEEHEEINNDDTIAEVDVYLAYGLYTQAEDLLNKGLDEQPDRVDYRFKLAETHYATRNTEAFEANAERMQEMLAGRPSQLWERVQSMGHDLSPDNPLFSGAPAMETGLPEAPGEVDLDLGVEDLEGSLGDMDLEVDADDQTGAADVESVQEAATEAPREPGPVGAGDEALEFDLGDLELDADSLDVDLTEGDTRLEEGARTEEDTRLEEGAGGTGEAPAAEASEPQEWPPAGGDDTKLEAVPDLGEFSEEPEFNLDDTLMDETSPTARPTGAEMSEDDTQIMEEDFSDVDFLSGDEDEGEDLLMAEDESADLPSGDEVSTKLDLARAYIDMGDSEGARSTLEEVIAEGNEEQKREAQGLIDQLG